MSSSNNVKEHADFDIYPQFDVMGTPVTMCRSKKTGLKLALVTAEGPMVSLYATGMVHPKIINMIILYTVVHRYRNIALFQTPYFLECFDLFALIKLF